MRTKEKRQQTVEPIAKIGLGLNLLSETTDGDSL
eukprot:COSAG06_NODE_62695_length_264_cov_0.812121_1_plen_33_part_01